MELRISVDEAGKMVTEYLKENGYRVSSDILFTYDQINDEGDEAFQVSVERPWRDKEDADVCI